VKETTNEKLVKYLALIDRLAAIVARCALGQRLLLVVDGFSAYVEASLHDMGRRDGEMSYQMTGSRAPLVG
jgi:hypothetical protein